MTTWTEEDREELASAIADGMIAEMTYDNMRQLVWDVFYDDMISHEWVDLLMYAEQYAPDLLSEDEVR